MFYAIGVCAYETSVAKHLFALVWNLCFLKVILGMHSGSSWSCKFDWSSFVCKILNAWLLQLFYTALSVQTIESNCPELKHKTFKKLVSVKRKLIISYWSINVLYAEKYQFFNCLFQINDFSVPWRLLFSIVDLLLFFGHNFTDMKKKFYYCTLYFIFSKYYHIRTQFWLTSHGHSRLLQVK